MTAYEHFQRAVRAFVSVAVLPFIAYFLFEGFMLLAAGQVQTTADESLAMRLPIGWSVSRPNRYSLVAKETRSFFRFVDGRDLELRIEAAVTPPRSDNLGFMPTMLLRSEAIHTALSDQATAEATDPDDVCEVERGTLAVNDIPGQYLIYEKQEGELTRIIVFWEGVTAGRQVRVRYASEKGWLKRGFLMRRLYTLELPEQDAAGSGPASTHQRHMSVL